MNAADFHRFLSYNLFWRIEVFPIFALRNLLIYDRKCKELHISQLIGFCIPYIEDS